MRYAKLEGTKLVAADRREVVMNVKIFKDHFTRIAKNEGKAKMPYRRQFFSGAQKWAWMDFP